MSYLHVPANSLSPDHTAAPGSRHVVVRLVGAEVSAPVAATAAPTWPPTITTAAAPPTHLAKPVDAFSATLLDSTRASCGIRKTAADVEHLSCHDAQHKIAIT